MAKAAIKPTDAVRPVSTPRYRRGLEEPLAASIALPKDVIFLITEGNYVLVDEKPWNQVRELLDDVSRRGDRPIR